MLAEYAEDVERRGRMVSRVLPTLAAAPTTYRRRPALTERKKFKLT
jgi:hypothetical protein